MVILAMQARSQSGCPTGHERSASPEPPLPSQTGITSMSVEYAAVGQHEAELVGNGDGDGNGRGGVFVDHRTGCDDDAYDPCVVSPDDDRPFAYNHRAKARRGAVGGSRRHRSMRQGGRRGNCCTRVQIPVGRSLAAGRHRLPGWHGRGIRGVLRHFLGHPQGSTSSQSRQPRLSNG